jgi:Uma2 family endonuclease
MSIASPPFVDDLAEEIFYPASDGEPMAETPVHVLAIMLLFQALEDFLAPYLDIYLAANMFWYWKKGDNKAKRAPDVMAIKGVGRRERRSFFSWKENGAVPNTIFEIVSEKTWRENLFENRPLYQRLGVREYILFDPESAYIQPGLQGFGLNDQGLYIPLKLDPNDCLHCEELGLRLKHEGRFLRLIDAKTGVPVLSRDERADAEALKAKVAQAQAEAAQAQVEAAQAHAEAAQAQAEAAQAQAEDAQRKVESERTRAEAEKARADALQLELERLRAQFEVKGRPAT